MPARFAPESPIVQAVESVLRQNPDGMLIPEIRRALIRMGRTGVLESDVKELVQLPLFRRLAGGRIILAELEPEAKPAPEAGKEQRPELPYEKFPSTLRDLPDMGAYVLFDIETNGLNPESSDFFQLSAIKVVNGKPATPVFDQYARLDTKTISRALKNKLHFDTLGLEERIAGAGAQDEVLNAFREFAGDLPLVAHNGTFDLAFLKKHDPDLPNKLIDSMELSLLADPGEPSHRLESLAERAGLVEGGQRWREVLQMDKKLGISAGLQTTPANLFHSAIFDCLALYFLLENALGTLRGLAPAQKCQFRLLDSGLGNWICAPPAGEGPPDDLFELIQRQPWTIELPEAGSDRTVPGLAFDEQAVENLYAAVLKKLGWAERPAQAEMVRQVTASLQESRAAMIEASTGTGKTLAYLVPALLQARAEGQPALVSTSTKALQDQLLYDLEHRLQPNLPFDFRFAVLKGQENYLCLSQLWQAYAEAFFGPDSQEIPFEEKLCLLYLLRFAEGSLDGDLQSVSYWLQSRFPILGYLKHQLASSQETCGSACTYREHCFFPRARALADQADLLVVNHTLLLVKPWGEDRRFNLVLDEAHNLEDAATSSLTEEASRQQIELLLRRLLQPGDKRGLLVLTRRWVADSGALGAALNSVRYLRRRVSEFGGYLKEYLSRQGVNIDRRYGASFRMRVAPRQAHYFAWEAVEQAQREILRELGELERALRSIIRQIPDEGAHARHELQGVLDRLVGTPEAAGQRALLYEIPLVDYDPLVMVHWIELTIRGVLEEGQEIGAEQIDWAFQRAPVRVGGYLENRLYQHTRGMVLTSATLTLAEGGFNFYLDRLGLQNRVYSQHLIQLQKAFDYEKHVMLGMPGYLKASARPHEIQKFQEEMARELSCFFEFTEGRGLVLHTARTRMEYVATRLEKNLSHLPVYWQRAGASTRILKEEFEANEESILLGVRSFWEGIDVPGPSLSYLVIEKLPFPVPTEPVIEARREELRAQGGNEWMDYLIPLAALHFKQGFGRLMRKKDDHGVVLFMDKTLRSGVYYREAVLGSLPGFKRTDDIMEAEENRLTFYQAVADHMRTQFKDWDWDRRLEMFPCIQEEALPEIERLLRELTLPSIVPEEDYDFYRPRLLQAAQALIPNFIDFRKEQDQAMQAMLAGNDTLVVLPTGSGKSLAFQLPALLRDGVTLVFSPLIALMRDQVDRLRELGLTLVDYIVSGQSGAHRDEVYRRMARGELRLVYIAPERIRDAALAEALRQAKIIQVVVDEAHCVHMWGHSFRPDFLNIPFLFPVDRPPFAALTATATNETRAAIAEGLQLRQGAKLVTRSIDRPELKFIVYNRNSAPERISTKNDKMRVLVKILRAAQRNDECAIVYTATIRQAEQLSRLLNLHGFTVRHYHGRMNAQQRQEVQESFREGIVKIIIATKAFGMGIDKSDVRYVIHYDLPGDIESYFQEAGRAGRDGKTAYCVLLYHKSDIGTQRYFIERAFPDEDTLNSLLLALRRQCDPEGRMLVRPADLAEEAGIDPENLDVTLHLLDRMGFLERSFNFTIMANILLNRSVEWIADRLGGANADLLTNLASKCGISDRRGIQIDLVEAARRVSSDPVLLDKLLTEVSSKGWAVYRPWDRGYILQAKERLLSGERARINESDVNQLRSSMNLNLRRMVNFAEILTKGDCRRRNILKHFNEELKERPAPCCDLCDPNQALPWQQIPSEEVKDLPLEVSPEYMALRAVEWNENRIGGRFTSPYTASGLVHLLAGNAYAFGKYEQDPIKSVRRIKRMEASPYYSVLKGLKGGETAIKNILDRLQQQGYIQTRGVTFSTPESGEITYQAVVLNEKGRMQVQSGKYL